MTSVNSNSVNRSLSIPAYYTGTGSTPVYYGMSGSNPYDFTIPAGAGNVYAQVDGNISGNYEIFIADGTQPCFGSFDIDWTDPGRFSLGVQSFASGTNRAIVSLPYTSGVNYHFSMQAKVSSPSGCSYGLSAAVYCHRP